MCSRCFQFCNSEAPSLSWGAQLWVSLLLLRYPVWVVDLVGNGSKEFHRRGIYREDSISKLFILIYFVILKHIFFAGQTFRSELIMFNIEPLSNSVSSEGNGIANYITVRSVLFCWSKSGWRGAALLAEIALGLRSDWKLHEGDHPPGWACD